MYQTNSAKEYLFMEDENKVIKQEQVIAKNTANEIVQKCKAQMEKFEIEFSDLNKLIEDDKLEKSIVTVSYLSCIE